MVSRRSGLFLAASIALFGWGCGGTNDDPPSRGGTLVVAIRGDLDSWNPYVSEDASSAAVLELLYPRLVRETWSEGKLSSFEPWLASSWEFSDDRKALTFHLRPEARWSNGTPVTCDDVRFTWRAQTSEALAWSGAFFKTKLRTVECPDPNTAVFRFTSVYADQMLDANDDAIVPQAYSKVPLENWSAITWERRLISCGPFRFASVTPGQEAILVRDVRWWGAADTYLDRVVLRIYPDATSGFLRFLDGEVDVFPKIPPLQAATAENRPGLKVVELPSLSYTYIGWNLLEPEAYLRDRHDRGCDIGRTCVENEQDILRLRRNHPHPILADARVRRALTLATDREDLIQGLWAGHALPGSSPIVSALWAHDPTMNLPFNSREATSLLKEAGWSDTNGDGILDREGKILELRVLVNAENQTRRDALERVTRNLARIGVRLVAEPVPRGEFASRGRFKNFDAILAGWAAGTRIEPQSILHTKAVTNRGNNLTAWSTPESDAILDRAQAAPTREAAAPLWNQWQAIFRDEQPYTILYEEKSLLGLNGRVRGPTPSALHPFQNLHQLWIAQEPATTDR